MRRSASSRGRCLARPATRATSRWSGSSVAAGFAVSLVSFGCAGASTGAVAVARTEGSASEDLDDGARESCATEWVSAVRYTAYFPVGGAEVEAVWTQRFVALLREAAREHPGSRFRVHLLGRVDPCAGEDEGLGAERTAAALRQWSAALADIPVSFVEHDLRARDARPCDRDCLACPPEAQVEAVVSRCDS